MSEEYDVEAIMNALREKEEMDPDRHDGCYELMRETISAYRKLSDFSVLDYKDLNLVYLTTVGTWRQGVDGKKILVEESHLLPDDKEYLTMLWDEVWDKACKGQYTNNELEALGGGSIGLFGTGFFSFEVKTTAAHSQEFIRMCCDILPMTDDNQMFSRAEQVLTASFKGMRAASASMVLHCLKPFSFPVLNSNMGRQNVFEVLGVHFNKRGNIETYIENCRKIKAFRDANFSYKNYRIFDIAAWKIAEYAKQHEYKKYGDWEIINETVARLDCYGGQLVLNQTPIPEEISWFFRVSDLRTGARQDVTLVHDGYEFDGYLQRENTTPIKTTLYWDQSLSEEIGAPANDGREVILDFTRTSNNRFEVRLIDPDQNEMEDVNRVWLISWNKNGWDWKDYKENCEEIKAGNNIELSWTCSSTKPQIGEEIFLIKLGDQPRGIIGHGYVTYESYEAEHYDPERAARGDTAKYIDVEFDCLLNYEKDNILSQEELVEKCRAQHWSPMSSGIEIKQEVLPTLRALWQAVTGDDNGAWWPSAEQYPVDITKDDWKRFIEEIELPKHKGAMRVLACYIDIGGIASPKTLSSKYKGHPMTYISSIVNTSKRALKYFGLDPCLDGDKKRWYFPITFFGHDGKGADAGTYVYKMRPELFEALQEIDLSGINLLYNSDDDIGEIGETGDDGGNGEMSGIEFDHNMILYGPPGTGKTYNSVIYAVAICEGRSVGAVRKEPYSDVMKRYNELRESGRIAFTTFHQSYGYEEFIEGIKPKLDEGSDTLGYTIEDGIFKSFCDRAKIENDPERPFVFIIDEINRGNISKIFGELITLIEYNKRAGAAEAMEAILPYSGKPFSVPENVYIVGTMNTADRSIALMDTALRRRFEFVEMMPKSEVLESLGVGTIAIGTDELNVARMLDVINERIEFLFDREHTIGHAFFTKLADDPSLETLAGIFEKNVIPLLQEYFYEDYEKIQLVLGDNTKEDEFKFILDRDIKTKTIFNGSPDIDLPEKGYKIQVEAFRKLQSYKLIGKDL